MQQNAALDIPTVAAFIDREERWLLRTPSELYERFARYTEVGERFCTYCYTEDKIAEITTSPLFLLDPELSRELLWESSDHWESSAVYRHYLPRCLEILGPPWLEEPMYPLHLSETLLSLGFSKWPGSERMAVITYLHAGVPELIKSFNSVDQAEWAAGIAALRGAGPRAPCDDV